MTLENCNGNVNGKPVTNGSVQIKNNETVVLKNVAGRVCLSNGETITLENTTGEFRFVGQAGAPKNVRSGQ
jgi:hypothetical protein